VTFNPQPKPLPRAVQKIKAHKDERKDDRVRKHVIRAFHEFRCSVCGKKGSIEVHEEKRRGAGGEVTLVNSYLACVPPTGACHALLQDRFIYAEMADGSEDFDARKPMRFSMSQRVADAVFPQGRIPAHCHVIPEGR
jgi:hypothetical protein